MDAIAPSRVLKPSVVCDRTSLDRVTIWRKVRSDDFPKPLKLSANRIGWLESEVEAWIASRHRSAMEAA
jgi:prophage regulatory protein